MDGMPSMEMSLPITANYVVNLGAGKYSSERKTYNGSAYLDLNLAAKAAFTVSLWPRGMLSVRHSAPFQCFARNRI